MQSLTFNIQGSSIEPYEVIFYLIDGKLSGSCTCAAGQVSKYCKHRLELLQGDAKAAINLNNSDHITAIKWYSSSDLKAKVDELNNIKKEIEALKNKQKSAETALSKLISR
ncbi:hypothetical protein HDF24_05845 [Mucilaginibacter sp. X4EP1]|uniref:hypothetical protein n=1 Tax=Mucilaginibacter sp. X4EP1 TaxID=2723092 RepID=UPI00216A3367|nr:hypothetical protein [Mucilaginibacter sp. X4EP1]MCS3814381.1 hypothetical protein [Mucilaginibacter sp. X4EP1]